MTLLTTIALMITATTLGESEFDSNISINTGERYYIGAEEAGETTSWYFKPSVGFNDIDGINYTFAGDLYEGVEFDTATSFNLGFGFHISSNLRIEIGYSDTENDVDSLSFNGLIIDLSSAGAQAGLEQETISAMFLYDFDTEGSWNPYVGIGIGNVDADINITVPADAIDFNSSISETAFIFAAGINWGISGNMDLFVEYRMTSWDSSDIDIDNNTLLVGVNWAF